MKMFLWRYKKNSIGIGWIVGKRVCGRFNANMRYGLLALMLFCINALLTAPLFANNILKANALSNSLIQKGTISAKIKSLALDPVATFAI